MSRRPGVRRPPAPRAQVEFLSRLLGRAGVMPAEQAEEAIRLGRVRINERVVKSPLASVGPRDVVRVDGQVVEAPRPRVLLFHKPAGMVTSHDDPEREGTVFDLLLPFLPEALRRFTWHAVGRLDRDTTGLLLFTNDERLLAHVTSPSSHLPKTYEAVVPGKATDEALEPLRRGQRADGMTFAPAAARLLGPGLVEVVLTEGKNHQVKRMLGAVGLPVRSLRRVAVGGVTLDVPLGGWRELTAKEISQGLRFAG